MSVDLTHISAMNQTPLRIRKSVSHSRPASIRRHTGRITARIAILLAGDVAAGFVYHLVALGAAGSSVVDRFIPGSYADLPGPAAGIDFGIALLASLIITGSYSRHRLTNPRTRLLTASVTGALAALLYWLVRGVVTGWTAVTLFAITAVLTWLVLLAERAITETVLRDVWPRNWGTTPAIVIGTGDALERQLESAVLTEGTDYRKVGHLMATPASADTSFPSTLQACISDNAIQAIIVCSKLDEWHLHQIVECGTMSGCQILYPARAVKLRDVSPRIVWHRDQPFLELGAPVLKASAMAVKRITDLIVSGILLILTAPVFLLIAVAIKLDSPDGPVFFSQDRAGNAGRRFRMLKFRTMRAGSDDEKPGLSHLNESGDPRMFKIRKDPRITRVGEFLRRWSLDELPQLINVLTGSMSLVGPRPFFEADFESYEDHHFRRLDAKPGITGLWQVSGRSDLVAFDDVVFLDRQYIEQWSFWLDVSILFRTIPAVVRGSGAY